MASLFCGKARMKEHSMPCAAMARRRAERKPGVSFGNPSCALRIREATGWSSPARMTFLFCDNSSTVRWRIKSTLVASDAVFSSTARSSLSFRWEGKLRLSTSRAYPLINCLSAARDSGLRAKVRAPALFHRRETLGEPFLRLR